MSPSRLDVVRERALTAGFEEAICSNCGLFDGKDGEWMGTCRRRDGDVQTRYGICTSWTTSTKAPDRPKVQKDGSIMLFPRADKPRETDRPPGLVEGLKCAEDGCDGELAARWSPKLGSWFYGCTRYPACRGTLPANADGSPRGEPRTKELQGWRNRTHEVFDRVWKDKIVSRRTAYAWLRDALGLPEGKSAHMGEMTIAQCQRVVELVQAMTPERWLAVPKPKRRSRKRRIDKSI